MIETAIERDFAGGRFYFALNALAVIAVEKGPISPALRSREYPVSIFKLYNELSAGVGIDKQTEQAVMLPGANVFYGDLHHILERALICAGSGEKDGEEFKVEDRMASRLVNDYLPRHIEACALLVWDILHSTIKGIDLKKKPLAEVTETPPLSDEANS
ncbi:hypothetical protein [Sphingobium yanoikuyae]|uniref:hypothetical protein n=1 Tax=Sphingobium yanoikuyae TaxID=13690 RepID=UPI0035C6EEAE